MLKGRPYFASLAREVETIIPREHGSRSKRCQVPLLLREASLDRNETRLQKLKVPLPTLSHFL